MNVGDTYVSVAVYLEKGENDDNVPWPFYATVTIELLNQLEDKNHHSKTATVDSMLWIKVIDHPSYISSSDLEAKNCQYLKDGRFYFRVTVDTEKHWLVV